MEWYNGFDLLIKGQEGENKNSGSNRMHKNISHAWDKCSDLVHWEDPEGSGGEGGGRGDQDGEYM